MFGRDATRPAWTLAAPSDLRKAWLWDDRPGVAKMLNDVADSMAATGFHDEAADLFERWVGGWVGGWVGSPAPAPAGDAVPLNGRIVDRYIWWFSC